MRIDAVNPVLQSIAQQATDNLPKNAEKSEDFGKMLMDVIKEVNASQTDAKDMQNAFMTGQQVELHELMISMERAGIAMELITFHGAPGVVVPLESPFVAAAQRAIEEGFGRRPVFIREGGSIPIVATFRSLLGVDTLLLGWGLADDNTHSPNEKFCLADFHRGIKASAHLWRHLGDVKNAG